MFESFSNIIFVLIALAVFIGRTVAQAQGRKKPEPGPRIPVHFEDGEAVRDRGGGDGPPPRVHSRNAPDYIRTRPAGARKKNPSASQTRPGLPPAGAGIPLSAAAPSLEPQAANGGTGAVQPPRQGVFNIAHLPPLKQAVVMSEILGPPKGLL